jgi:glucose/arabinose dehydrogenase
MFHALHPSRDSARRWLGNCLALMLVASCTKKEQAALDAAPVGAAATAPAAGAAERGAPSGSPGAGPTEVPQRSVAEPGPGARNGPSESPKGPPTLAGLRLPPGFSIEVYSDAVPNARSLALGPKGVVFASNRRADKVYALVDADGDHHADAVKVVASGLDTPNGIAYRDGALFIAEVGRLLRIDGIDGKLDDPPLAVCPDRRALQSVRARRPTFREHRPHQGGRHWAGGVRERRA